jgi:hypothetical protein
VSRDNGHVAFSTIIKFPNYLFITNNCYIWWRASLNNVYMSLPMWLLWIHYMTCGLRVKQASFSCRPPLYQYNQAPAGTVTTASSWSALPQKPDMSADVVTNTGTGSDVRHKQTRPNTQNGQGFWGASSPLCLFNNKEFFVYYTYSRPQLYFT